MSRQDGGGAILEPRREAVRTGVPVARPLFLQYPDEPEAARQDQAFLLGPDVLAAPVVAGCASREVWFPPAAGGRPRRARSTAARAPSASTRLP